MSKIRVRVERPFGVYNAGDVIGLSSADVEKHRERVAPVEPGANRLGPPPTNERGADGKKPAEDKAKKPDPKPETKKAADAKPDGKKPAEDKAKDKATGAKG